jgi:purine-nucleoside phosphorylase
MLNLNSKYKELTDFISDKFNEKAEAAIVLGSGLGDFVKNLDVKKSINTSSIPGYPISTIKGHEGKIHLVEFENKNLLIFQGRIHFYEGYRLSECILPAFIPYKLGCKNLILTNAAGGINPNFVPGDLMLISSFNSIGIKKELAQLIGLASNQGKNSLFNFPSRELYSKIISAAAEEKIILKEGVYCYTKGPSYETPSEIKMMGKFGADAVGMSTAHEAIFAAYLGMQTASISCITNYAAGISGQKLDHKEVTQTANLVKDKFERLLRKTISLL